MPAPISTNINAPIPNAAPIPAIHFNINLPSSVKNKIYSATAPTPIANKILIIIHKTTADI